MSSLPSSGGSSENPTQHLLRLACEWADETVSPTRSFQSVSRNLRAAVAEYRLAQRTADAEALRASVSAGDSLGPSLSVYYESAGDYIDLSHYPREERARVLARLAAKQETPKRVSVRGIYSRPHVETPAPKKVFEQFSTYAWDWDEVVRPYGEVDQQFDDGRYDSGFERGTFLVGHEEPVGEVLYEGSMDYLRSLMTVTTAKELHFENRSEGIDKREAI